VDEFVATLYQHGIVIDRRSVEQEMHERIADIAERLGTCPETVLREHARQGWGRQMASGVMTQIRDEQLFVPSTPPTDPSAPVAG
jgi:IS30 family transposase